MFTCIGLDLRIGYIHGYKNLKSTIRNFSDHRIHRQLIREEFLDAMKEAGIKGKFTRSSPRDRGLSVGVKRFWAATCEAVDSEAAAGTANSMQARS